MRSGQLAFLIASCFACGLPAADALAGAPTPTVEAGGERDKTPDAAPSTGRESDLDLAVDEERDPAADGELDPAADGELDPAADGELDPASYGEFDPASDGAPDTAPCWSASRRAQRCGDAEPPAISRHDTTGAGLRSRLVPDLLLGFSVLRAAENEAGRSQSLRSAGWVALRWRY